MRVHGAADRAAHGAPAAAASGRGRRPGRGARAIVDDAATRAILPGTSGNDAELDFVYRGPTDSRARLASGAERAQDSCNLLYVMWRVPATIVVQLKHNPGIVRHEDCGNRGYASVRPTTSAAIPALVEGEHHVLAARIDRDTLEVTVDG